MESDQVDVITAAVFCNFQQRFDALEARFARQVVGDVVERDRRDGIDDDVAVVHLITATDFHVRPRPDANAASNSAASNAVPKPLREHHRDSPSDAKPMAPLPV